VNLAKALSLAVWVGASLLLLVLLFRFLDTSAEEMAVAFLNTPVWLYIVIVLLTAVNQYFGALKWRVATRWLSSGDHLPSLWVMSEVTTIGSLFSQFLPPQVSLVAVRWWTSNRFLRRENRVVSSTLFEQIFDFLVLLIAGLAGAIFLLVNTPPYTIFVFAVVAFFFGLYLLRFFLLLGVLTSQSIGRIRFLRNFAKVSHEAFLKAYEAPMRVSMSIATLSVAGFFCRAARIAVIVIAFAPAADVTQVLAVHPAIWFLVAVPVTPGGIGVVEWSWSGLLIAAGATASSAAIAAIAFRLLTIISLAVILAGFAAVRLSRLRVKP
jgi:uncharacterized membrane protein YbhN (UPF0104 family)